MDLRGLSATRAHPWVCGGLILLLALGAAYSFFQSVSSAEAALIFAASAADEEKCDKESDIEWRI